MKRKPSDSFVWRLGWNSRTTRNIIKHHSEIRFVSIANYAEDGIWVPYELSDRNKKQRKTGEKNYLDRFQRKVFLHRIITGNDWHYDNPKRKKRSQSQYPLKEGFTLYVVGPAQYTVLRYCKPLQPSATSAVAQSTWSKGTDVDKLTRQIDSSP